MDTRRQNCQLQWHQGFEEVQRTVSLVAALSPIPGVCRTCEQQTAPMRVANGSDVRAAKPDVATDPIIVVTGYLLSQRRIGEKPSRKRPHNISGVYPAASGVDGSRDHLGQPGPLGSL